MEPTSPAPTAGAPGEGSAAGNGAATSAAGAAEAAERIKLGEQEFAPSELQARLELAQRYEQESTEYEKAKARLKHFDGMDDADIEALAGLGRRLSSDEEFAKRFQTTLKPQAPADESPLDAINRRLQEHQDHLERISKQFGGYVEGQARERTQAELKTYYRSTIEELKKKDFPEAMEDHVALQLQEMVRSTGKPPDRAAIVQAMKASHERVKAIRGKAVGSFAQSAADRAAAGAEAAGGGGIPSKKLPPIGSKEHQALAERRERELIEQLAARGGA